MSYLCNNQLKIIPETLWELANLHYLQLDGNSDLGDKSKTYSYNNNDDDFEAWLQKMLTR